MLCEIILLFFFSLCGKFVLKKSIAFRISTLMLYSTERQIMCVAKVFKKFSLFPNFSLYGLFQARKTEVAMNLSDFWLKAELPGFLQLAERLHFKELTLPIREDNLIQSVHSEVSWQ